MIHRASFRNFKALKNVDITFDSRLTVLVGPNGSGKTSVLQGIRLACQAAAQPEQNNKLVFELWRSLSIGARANDMLLECISNINSFQRLKVRLSGRRSGDWPDEITAGWIISQERDGQATIHWKNRSDISPDIQNIIVKEFCSEVLLRMEVAKLAAAAQPNAIPPTVSPDGSGLAPALAYLKLNEPDQFDAIVAELRRVIPRVEGIRFTLTKTEGFSQELLFDFEGARGVRADQASTGTLHALGLLAVILGANRPKLILLDDLDHGLHPRGQIDLVAVLRKLLADNPELQVIATSHSPYILDRLEPNEVRVVTLGDDGGAICAPLTAHPEFDKWKASMSPGEFWSYVWEGWAKDLKTEPAAATP